MMLSLAWYLLSRTWRNLLQLVRFILSGVARTPLSDTVHKGSHSGRASARACSGSHGGHGSVHFFCSVIEVRTVADFDSADHQMLPSSPSTQICMSLSSKEGGRDSPDLQHKAAEMFWGSRCASSGPTNGSRSPLILPSETAYL